MTGMPPSTDDIIRQAWIADLRAGYKQGYGSYKQRSGPWYTFGQNAHAYCGLGILFHITLPRLGMKKISGPALAPGLYSAIVGMNDVYHTPFSKMADALEQVRPTVLKGKDDARSFAEKSRLYTAMRTTEPSMEFYAPLKEAA